MGQELLFSHFGDKETISIRIKKKKLAGPSASLVILLLSP